VLKDRLGPVLEKRRGIEQIFMELHAHQNDLERTLDELASADDAVALDISLKNMIEFVKRSHGRCDDIERALKIASGLKEEYAELRNRLVPLGATEGGIANRVEELSEARNRLTAELDTLQQTPEGPLSQRVQQFLDDKKWLDRRLAEMTDDFAKLATLRRDVGALFAGFNRALHGLALSARGEGAPAMDAGVAELNEFITATQAQLDDIERRLVTFRQLRTRLGEVQTRLVPLEADEGGVISAIEELKDVRDRLKSKITRMEESDEGSLSERVHKFTESRKELEERVLHLNEEFLKLTSIRKDISNLFERLSSAVSASAK
jgi:chromosome segregation ATPase